MHFIDFLHGNTRLTKNKNNAKYNIKVKEETISFKPGWKACTMFPKSAVDSSATGAIRANSRRKEMQLKIHWTCMDLGDLRGRRRDER